MLLMKLKRILIMCVRSYQTLLFVKDVPHLITDPDVLYIEHNILDFYEDRIEKLGSLDLLLALMVLYNQIIITLIIYV